jgi:hypothetical protein
MEPGGLIGKRVQLLAQAAGQAVQRVLDTKPCSGTGAGCSAQEADLQGPALYLCTRHMLTVCACTHVFAAPARGR